MPIRTGLTTVGTPGSTAGLKPQDVTLAEILKARGYATAQFGKNHLGDLEEHLPHRHGFDEFWGKLRINLDRPYDQSVPKQYREWCKEHKEMPMGEKILLANFCDLEKNLGTYRQIWVDNMAVDGNYIFFDFQD
jgi:arylsulfatase A-like enzyme